MAANSFSVPPAPIQSSLELVDGRITSQPWLAWLNRVAVPVLQQSVADQTSVEDLLLYRSPAQGGEGSALVLPLGVSRPSPETAQLPPHTPRTANQSDLAML